MKYYVVCPYCGYELLKIEDYAFVELSCPKCNEEIIIEVKNNILTIQRPLSAKVSET